MLSRRNQPLKLLRPILKPLHLRALPLRLCLKLGRLRRLLSQRWCRSGAGPASSSLPMARSPTGARRDTLVRAADLLQAEACSSRAWKVATSDLGLVESRFTRLTRRAWACPALCCAAANADFIPDYEAALDVKDFGAKGDGKTGAPGTLLVWKG